MLVALAAREAPAEAGVRWETAVLGEPERRSANEARAAAMEARPGTAEVPAGPQAGLAEAENAALVPHR